MSDGKKKEKKRKKKKMKKKRRKKRRKGIDASSRFVDVDEFFMTQEGSMIGGTSKVSLSVD